MNIDKQLAKMIDHTLLKPNASQKQIEKLCHEAIDYGFCSVAVNSCWTEFCAEQLSGSDVKVTTCIGFPLGAADSDTKAFEAAKAVEHGTGEIDMVINVGKLLDDDIDYVTRDIAKVVNAAGNVPVKVILECCLLDDEAIEKACKACIDAKAAFVKTSTGFSTGGATVENVRLMSEVVSSKGLGVKAAGGIHNKEEALSMIEAGATRIGASNGIEIVSSE